MTLSPRQREIVVLIGRDGCQWETVARQLGIKLTTVRSHTQKILNRYPSTQPPRAALVELYWRVVATDDDRSDAA